MLRIIAWGGFFMAIIEETDLNLEIMMIGGRRTGKTSVLAAMHGCFDSVFGKTDIICSVGGESTLDIIEAKRQEMIDYLALASQNKDFVPDGTPTAGDETYTFDIFLKNKRNNKIHLNFYDFPGEWIKEKSADIQEKIAKSHVLMIVIDTPYLMEENGQYNDRRNRCYRITEMIKGNFDINKSELPKLVLFVPLKCEKYYWEDRMNEVAAAIRKEEVYGSLINYLSSGQNTNCELAITPILTIGTAIFSRFERDKETHDFIMNEKYKYPNKPLYYFNEEACRAAVKKGSNQKYAADPQYCEQPLIYTLSYALKMMAMAIEKDNNDVGFWANLFGSSLFPMFLKYIKENWLNFASASDFIAQRAKIQKHLVLDEHGFTILSDPLKFKAGV